VPGFAKERPTASQTAACFNTLTLKKGVFDASGEFCKNQRRQFALRWGKLSLKAP
jgi:hypothetical protein